MSALILHVIAWPTLGLLLLVFGFAPGAVLRLIVLMYPPDHPRRRELIAELYVVPRIERPFWVAEQVETALFEGLGGHLTAWRAKRLVPVLVYVRHPTGGLVTLQLRLVAELKRTTVGSDQFWHGISKALSEHYHVVHCANSSSERAAEQVLKDDVFLGYVQRCAGCDAPPEGYHQEDAFSKLWMWWWPETGSAWLWMRWL
jgi:hypothetical protein